MLLKFGSISTFIFIDSLQVLFQLLTILFVLSGLSCSFFFKLVEFFSLFELSKILSSSSSCLEISFKFGICFGMIFLKLSLNICLCCLIVCENLLEVLVRTSILKFLLEFTEFVTLLDLIVLLKLFSLKLSFSFEVVKIILEFFLDLNNDSILLLLLFNFNHTNLVFNFLKFIGKLLTLLSSSV